MKECALASRGDSSNGGRKRVGPIVSRHVTSSKLTRGKRKKGGDKMAEEEANKVLQSPALSDKKK